MSDEATKRCKNCSPSNCKNTNCSILSAHIAWKVVFDFVTEQVEKVKEQKNESNNIQSATVKE